MDTIVSKFGGTSLAGAPQIRKVMKIINDQPSRKFVVVSAPGKRTPADRKITDLLLLCHELAKHEEKYDDVFAGVAERFTQIVEQLGITFDIGRELGEIKRLIQRQKTNDFAASRGEYLMAKIMAAALGWPFIDAALIVRFDSNGRYDDVTTRNLAEGELKRYKNAVIPGFYGSLATGDIRIFPRNYSDFSGAIIARAAKAEVYENWSDQPGYRSAPPEFVSGSKAIFTMTHEEMRELSAMGSSVIHHDTVLPLMESGIPIHLLHTHDPMDEGTLIVPKHKLATPPPPVTGVTGMKGFSIVTVTKTGMDNEDGFARRLLEAFEDLRIGMKHFPTGMDVMSVVCPTQDIDPCRKALDEAIRVKCSPESIVVEDGLAIVAAVGRGMSKRRGTAAKFMKAVADADVNIRLISQGGSEMTILIGVDEADLSKAVNAVYRAFF